MTVRRRHLPPLNALRAFEAAARHLHLGKAADELSVTHGAISKHIANLEDHLGLMLFIRAGNRIALTERGLKLLAATNAALDQLGYAIARLDGESVEGELRLSMPPAFAASWLIPRLAKFRQLAPLLRLHILSSNGVDDVLNDNTDLAVRFGKPVWKNCAVRLLAHVRYFPVCSPKLLAQPPGLSTTADLAQHTLLLDDPEGENWKRWLEHAALRDVVPRSTLNFQDFSHILAAARQGLGLCLGDAITTGADLASGALVRPFEQSVEDQGAYFLISPPLVSPTARIFADWLEGEMLSSISSSES
ncbi:MAG: LysR family transcriptional regulator [Alphaproteobacteria bacterium]|nr:MAG: LysR family transcriptional regulator [Alphaproteobacteria bacterium]TMJ38401.1 MAG: LysR family transcriptional regulator [Alphaproteobacteria bacterium]